MDENLKMTEFKESFGEINSPFSLVKEMLSLFPQDFLFNKNNKWLDPGCGQGNISWILYQTLLSKIQDSDYILNNMLFMLEMNVFINLGICFISMIMMRRNMGMPDTRKMATASPRDLVRASSYRRETTM